MSETVATYGVATGTGDIALLPAHGRGWSRCILLARAGRAACIREPRSRFPETLLHAAWKRLGHGSGAIAGRDGHSYRVVYPGRPADGAGPDFRDAVLLRDDGVAVHGDVEVHVRSGDWHSHGHGADRAYNGVVLHVAMTESGAAVETMSGMRIPLLILGSGRIHGAAGTDFPGSDPGGPESVASIPLPFLDMAAAGDEWFRNRSHGCAMEIAAMGADQALWEGALECLGYPANKKGFRQVASRLGWEKVATAAESGVDMAMLFARAAGFGPAPEGAPALRGRAPEWKRRHGRPANRPETRARAAAAWTTRWLEAGGPARAFTGALAKAARPSDLSQLFTVQAGPGSVAPLGAARAKDIVVNHLLPSVHAMATAAGRTRLAAHAKHLFDEHSLLQPNSITREASRLLATRGARSVPRSAREQQGLIHIYRMATSLQQPARQLPLV